MQTFAVIIGNNPVKLWGLSAEARLRRQLANLDIEIINPSGEQTNTTEIKLLLINANFLFELRTLRALTHHENAILRHPDAAEPAAALVNTADIVAASEAFTDAGSVMSAQLHSLEPAELETYDDHLRRAEPPLLKLIHVEQQAQLEALLYGNTYKGVTDFVTKWWWPKPAKYLVGVAARAGITPNQVTITGLLLVIAATILFAKGAFLSGLVCGWIMTLLDTVDGKLARVTVQSSRIGHVLDHGMDIIHPPFWYCYWGVAVATNGMIAGHRLFDWCALIVVAYVGGRIVEGLFHALGSCSLFAWRPLDAYFRLFTARRNPCLVILTALTLIGHAELGFIGVAFWTALSTVLMTFRLLYAAMVRVQHGPLSSWLSENNAAERYPQAFLTFSGTRQAYD